MQHNIMQHDTVPDNFGSIALPKVLTVKRCRNNTISFEIHDDTTEHPNS